MICSQHHIEYHILPNLLDVWPNLLDAWSNLLDIWSNLLDAWCRKKNILIYSMVYHGFGGTKKGFGLWYHRKNCYIPPYIMDFGGYQEGLVTTISYLLYSNWMNVTSYVIYYMISTPIWCNIWYHVFKKLYSLWYHIHSISHIYWLKRIISIEIFW